MFSRPHPCAAQSAIPRQFGFGPRYRGRGRRGVPRAGQGTREAIPLWYQLGMGCMGTWHWSDEFPNGICAENPRVHECIVGGQTLSVGK